jgi:acyl-coenzyme A synthetase/AMP-(fatty) acid ligase
MQTGDAAFVDDDGYVHVMSRIDDVINVAGHRLSTGAMEAAIATHPGVAECAVVGPHGTQHFRQLQQPAAAYTVDMPLRR